MIKKDWFIAVAALLTASYFSACSVTDSESDDYAKWEFSGYVLDASTGKGLANASITYQDGGKQKEVFTKEDGSFFIDNLTYGTLSFSFSYTEINKKDTLVYVPKVITMGSTNESSSMQGVVASTSYIARLSPLNAGISGEFYIQDPVSGKDIPVTKTRVQILHSDTTFVKANAKNFESKTDSLGKFSFEKLPADSGLTLEIAPFEYKSMRFYLPATILPRLQSNKVKEIGRAYLTRDTLIVPPSKIKASNVMDADLNGYKNLSPLIVPYFVFNEAITDQSLSVTLSNDSSFNLLPKIHGDTLFLNHSQQLPPNTEFTTKIIAYTKKKNERIEIELDGKSAFSTGRGLYAVTSNGWPENENYKALFSTEDTLWIKFSEELASNVERIQWHFMSDVGRPIYCSGYRTNSDAWVKKDTLFVQMREKILDSRTIGDSVGINATIYAKSGLFIENFILKVELDVPPSSSSSSADSTTSSSSVESSAANSDSIAESSSSVVESSSSAAAVSSSSTAEASSSSAE